MKLLMIPKLLILWSGRRGSNPRRPAWENAQRTSSDRKKHSGAWGHTTDDELVGRSRVNRTGISGAGPVYLNAQEQLVAVRQRIAEVRQDQLQVEQSSAQERDRLERSSIDRSCPW